MFNWLFGSSSSTRRTCSSCNGTGWYKDHSSGDYAEYGCSSCGGNNDLRGDGGRAGSGYVYTTETLGRCSRCGGSGRVKSGGREGSMGYTEKCSSCDGSGKTWS